MSNQENVEQFREPVGNERDFKDPLLVARLQLEIKVFKNRLGRWFNIEKAFEELCREEPTTLRLWQFIYSKTLIIRGLITGELSLNKDSSSTGIQDKTAGLIAAKKEALHVKIAARGEKLGGTVQESLPAVPAKTRDDAVPLLVGDYRE